METSNMKNMVVLKNLPSNMIEEAIIIFKESQKVRQKELIERSKNSEFIEGQSKSKEYILKEAEMLVEDYICRVENNTKYKKSEKTMIQKYQKLKKYCICSTIFLIISLIINFI